MPEKRLDVPAAAQHAQNHDVMGLDSVDDDVLADGNAAQACAQIVVAAAADVGIFGNQQESVGDGIDQAIRNFDVASFGRDVVPDALEIGIRLRAADVSHLNGALLARVLGGHGRAVLRPRQAHASILA